MTEDLNVFPNAKSPLFGAGEDSIGFIQTAATAKLTGTATQAESTTGNANVNKSGFSVSVNQVQGKLWPIVAGTNEASVVVTTPTDSLVVVAASAVGWLNVSGSGTMFVRVLDGTSATILKTASLAVGGGTDAMLDVLFVGTPISGSRTYNVQCWNTNGDVLMYVTLSVSHVQLDDTHAGAIDTVAIAGKQINAADSHTTREISVLPG